MIAGLRHTSRDRLSYFPLTLTLSLREREQHGGWLVFSQWSLSRFRHGCDARRWIVPPLPGGGEGRRDQRPALFGAEAAVEIGARVIHASIQPSLRDSCNLEIVPPTLSMCLARPGVGVHALACPINSCAAPGRPERSPAQAPLRTVRESFPSHGSSLSMDTTRSRVCRLVKLAAETASGLIQPLPY
jgi:hypothetical protein